MVRIFLMFLIALMLVSPAVSERAKLKTGEWLSDSSYGEFRPIGDEKALTLTVKFESKAEPRLREQSLRELVVKHLLPTAMRDGYTSARLLEERIGIKVGIFTAEYFRELGF